MSTPRGGFAGRATGQPVASTDLGAGPTDAVSPYVMALALGLPVTSVLLIPGIQGTTLGYLLALGLLVPVVTVWVIGTQQASRYFGLLVLILCGFASYTAIAQFLLASSPPIDPVLFQRMPLMDSRDGSLVLRGSMFSQSIYLLAALSVFALIRVAYQPNWDAYLVGGAVALAAYGLWELLFFLATGSNGDFLTNRTFGDDIETPGSLFQTLHIGPIELPRVKSLTGEPSMFAFTMLPFWIYAVHTGRRVHWFLLAMLLLSTSTTAFMGITAYLALRFVLRGGRDCAIALVFLVGAVVVLMLWMYGNEAVTHAFNTLIGDKLAARDNSGSVRLGNATAVLNVYMQLPVASQLFGIGFGYVRSTDFLTTLLINVGLLGLLGYIMLFAVPVIRLGNSAREVGLRCALAVVWLTSMISVPEFAYLSSWVFLGLGYHALAERRRKQLQAETAAPPHWQAAPPGGAAL
jgi:hypothetical protein